MANGESGPPGSRAKHQPYWNQNEKKPTAEIGFSSVGRRAADSASCWSWGWWCRWLIHGSGGGSRLGRRGGDGRFGP